MSWKLVFDGSLDNDMAGLCLLKSNNFLSISKWFMSDKTYAIIILLKYNPFSYSIHRNH